MKWSWSDHMWQYYYRLASIILPGFSESQSHKYKTLTQWFCVTVCLFGWYLHIPANTGHSLNAVLMLGQRWRRWANIETYLSECPVFAGIGPRGRLKVEIHSSPACNQTDNGIEWPKVGRHSTPACNQTDNDNKRIKVGRHSPPACNQTDTDNERLKVGRHSPPACNQTDNDNERLKVGRHSPPACNQTDTDNERLKVGRHSPPACNQTDTDNERLKVGRYSPHACVQSDW